MQPTTTMDVIDAREGVVSKDEFTINKYTLKKVQINIFKKTKKINYN